MSGLTATAASRMAWTRLADSSSVSAVDAPLPYAANLEHAALPQPDWIVEAAREVCYARD